MVQFSRSSIDRKTALKYKKLLLEHGIIKGGWEKFIRQRIIFQQIPNDQMGSPRVREVPEEGGSGRMRPWIILQQ